jgi:hypothetical protein
MINKIKKNRSFSKSVYISIGKKNTGRHCMINKTASTKNNEQVKRIQNVEKYSHNYLECSHLHQPSTNT